ncbi:MAG: hypothetical protein Q4F21_00085 [Lachnospiraceae bacterium]|nr:hypothetical protein [Lachnospiraceae bacterium]
MEEMENKTMKDDNGKQDMIEKLSEKAKISQQEAKEVLERNNWDLLDSMLELDRAGRIPDQERGAKTGTGYSTEDQDSEEFQQVTVTASRTSDESTGSRLKRILKKLLRKSLDNDFVVSRSGKEILHVPVLVPILLFFAGFWPMLIILCVGLLTGFRYSFRGNDLGTENVNHTMDRMAECAEDIKVKVKEFIDEENTDSRG